MATLIGLVMAWRQAPSIIAAALLGLGLAQVGDTSRDLDSRRPIHAQDRKTLADASAPAQKPTVQVAKPQTIHSASHRTSQDGQRVPAYADAPPPWRAPFDTYGIYGTPSDVGGPVVYWAPGRWYPYPGFGDKRNFGPQPEGVWSR